MSKLLHIQVSPRIGRSASIAVAEHFVEVYRARHAGDTVETLNLWETELPEFNGAAIDAKYAIMHGQPHTPAQLEAWKAVVRIADHFKSADKYLSDAGWTVVGCTSLGEPIYDDPLGNADQKGQVVRACELPATQEGTRPVQVDQLVVPPTPWSYNMRHAVAIQRARDNHAIKQQQRKAG